MVQAVALREVAPPQPRWEVGLMAGQGFLEICDPTSDCSAFLCSEGIVTKSFFVYNPNKLCSQPSLNKVFFMYVCILFKPHDASFSTRHKKAFVSDQTCHLTRKVTLEGSCVLLRSGPSHQASWGREGGDVHHGPVHKSQTGSMRAVAPHPAAPAVPLNQKHNDAKG